MDTKRLLRLALLGSLLFLTYYLGKKSGATAYLEPNRLRQSLATAGILAYPTYIAVFALGELLHIPGLVFVALGVLLWGRSAGFVLSYVAALASVSLTFFVIRGVGGQILEDLGRGRPFVQRILSHLTDRPIRTVAILRMVFFLAPPLNTALALSQVRYREYLLGSAMGLLPTLTLAVIFFEYLLSYLHLAP